MLRSMLQHLLGLSGMLPPNAVFYLTALFFCRKPWLAQALTKVYGYPCCQGKTGQ